MLSVFIKTFEDSGFWICRLCRNSPPEIHQPVVLMFIAQFETFEDSSPFSRERTIFKDAICAENLVTYSIL
jgi:hypothetical protein